jgi:hypothetical protein
MDGRSNIPYGRVIKTLVLTIIQRLGQNCQMDLLATAQTRGYPGQHQNR